MSIIGSEGVPPTLVTPIKEQVSPSSLNEERIIFKKPTKRTSSEVGGAVGGGGGLYVSSSKRKNKDDKTDNKPQPSNRTAIKNSCLLSFEDKED